MGAVKLAKEPSALGLFPHVGLYKAVKFYTPYSTD